MNIINEATELVDVRSLKPHPKNANRSDAGLIAESIETNGWYGQIIAQRSTGHILVGHHRLQAAQQLGATEVPVTWVDVDNTRALKIMLADNATAAAAHRDEQALADLLSELQLTDTLTGTGYADADLDALLTSIAADAPTPEPLDAPEPQIDRAEELRVKWQTERGQLWVIPSRTTPGKAHRLLCGDSTVAEDVARLMDGQKADMVFTDPPYGYSYQSNFRSKTKKFDVLENDDTILDGFVPLIAPHVAGWALICTSWKVVAEWVTVTASLGTMQNMIVWDKGGGGMGDLAHSLSTDYELILAYGRGAEIQGKRLGSVWTINKDGPADYVHATQKPVELVEQALQTFAPKRGSVLDFFMGSGTTICAAERQGCTSYGLELTPSYLAVILERLSGMGLAPELQPPPE